MINRVLPINANALRLPIADKSVQCVVTSPPYYGLRDYGNSEQLGLEPTLDEYIQNTVLWAREVWRVLRDDGTFWLNLGDSYAGSGGPGSFVDNKQVQKFKDKFEKYDNPNRKAIGFKPKDLMMVPHRTAIALQADGWYLRSDIVWAKPNPMPESVKDRPTKSHEYIFLLTKKAKYYYDADAIREPVKPNSIERLGRAVSNQHKNMAEQSVPPGSRPHTMHKKRINQKEYKRLEGKAANTFDGADHLVAPFDTEKGRNKRSVWTVTTKGYPGSHFATFPPDLIEPCIKAGTSEKGACPDCGAPWERVVERKSMVIERSERTHKLGRTRSSRTMVSPPKTKTVGWQPTCKCNVTHKFDDGNSLVQCQNCGVLKEGVERCHGDDPQLCVVPCKTFDPFGGSGTTAMVARNLGRIGICTDISWDYIQLQKERLGMTALQEFEAGKKVESNYSDTPLFENLQ